MSLYECLIITRQNFLQNNKPDDLLEKVTSIFGDKGSILRHEYWGLRNFAYVIRKKRRGHYVMVYADAQVEAIEALQRKMYLDDNILRYLITKISKVPDYVSPLAQEESEEENISGDSNSNNNATENDNIDDSETNVDESLNKAGDVINNSKNQG